MTKKRVPANQSICWNPLVFCSPMLLNYILYRKSQALHFSPTGCKGWQRAASWPTGAWTVCKCAAGSFPNYNRRCPSRAMEAPKGVGYVLAVRQNRKSRRLESRMAAMFSSAILRTFSFGMRSSSFAIMSQPTFRVSGLA